MFEETPAADESYPNTEGGRLAYNARVPLPLSLGDIRARVDSGYYRSAEALK